MQAKKIGFLISCFLDTIVMRSLIELYNKNSYIHIFIEQRNINKLELKRIADICTNFSCNVSAFNIKNTLNDIDIIFISNPYFDISLYEYIDKLGIKIIYIPYGISISDEDYSFIPHYSSKIIKLSYRVYTLSEYHKNLYIKYNSSKSENFINIKTSPKFDHVLSCINTTYKNNDKYIFMWNIHYSILPEKTMHRTWSAFFYYYQTILDILNENKNIIIIARLHPSLLRYAPETAAKALSIFKDCDNFMLEEGNAIDYSGSFSKADCYITDLSSMFFDFIVTKKPVISLFYPFSCHINKFAKYLFKKFSYHVHTPEELKQKILLLSSSDDPQKEQRIKILNNGNLFDLSRPACEIIADDLAASAV